MEWGVCPLCKQKRELNNKGADEKKKDIAEILDDAFETNVEKHDSETIEMTINGVDILFSKNYNKMGGYFVYKCSGGMHVYIRKEERWALFNTKREDLGCERCKKEKCYFWKV